MHLAKRSPCSTNAAAGDLEDPLISLAPLLGNFSRPSIGIHLRRLIAGLPAEKSKWPGIVALSGSVEAQAASNVVENHYLHS